MPVEWRQRIERAWANLRFGSSKVENLEGRYAFAVHVYLNGVDPGEVSVQLYGEGGEGGRPVCLEMKKGSPLVAQSTDILRVRRADRPTGRILYGPHHPASSRHPRTLGEIPNPLAEMTTALFSFPPVLLPLPQASFLFLCRKHLPELPSLQDLLLHQANGALFEEGLLSGKDAQHPFVSSVHEPFHLLVDLTRTFLAEALRTGLAVEVRLAGDWGRSTQTKGTHAVFCNHGPGSSVARWRSFWAPVEISSKISSSATLPPRRTASLSSSSGRVIR